MPSGRLFGHQTSPETREKIKNSLKGRSVSPSTQFKKGQRPHNWTGKPFKLSSGYMGVYCLKPNGKMGTRMEHTVIAERILGRPLKKGEVVHHIDGDKMNNKNSNLLICENWYHRWLHNLMSYLYQKQHFGAAGG